jgi:hypothetical protein
MRERNRSKHYARRTIAQNRGVVVEIMKLNGGLFVIIPAFTTAGHRLSLHHILASMVLFPASTGR